MKNDKLTNEKKPSGIKSLMVILSLYIFLNTIFTLFIPSISDWTHAQILGQSLVLFFILIIIPGLFYFWYIKKHSKWSTIVITICIFLVMIVTRFNHLL